MITTKICIGCCRDDDNDDATDDADEGEHGDDFAIS